MLIQGAAQRRGAAEEQCNRARTTLCVGAVVARSICITGVHCSQLTFDTLCLSIGREMAVTNRRMPMHTGRASRVHLHQLTPGVTPRALCALAAQVVKVAGCERRGSAFAALRSAPALREPKER